MDPRRRGGRSAVAIAASLVSAGAGATIDQRLKIFAALALRTALVDERVALVRASIAEARRFPELASHVHRMLRERGESEVGRLFAELAAAAPCPPPLAPELLVETSRRLMELAVLPLIMRAMFGEPLPALRDEVDAHVERAVEFFVAAHHRA
jgi:hypothetical protein